MPELFTTLSNGPVSETLTFKTSLSISRNGTEHRLPARLAPRLSLTGSYVLTGDSDTPAFRALTRGEDVLVPLRMLPMTLSGDAFKPTDSPISAGADVIRQYLDGSYDVSPADAAGNTPSGSALGAYPAALMSLQSSATLVTESLLHTLHQLTLTLETVYPYTRFAPLLGAVVDTPPPAWLMHNWATARRRSIETVSDELDVDVRSRKFRYSRTGYDLSIPLMSRAQIYEFRRWVCALRGAAGSFTWVIPGETEPRRFRLGADTVTIEHITSELAQVSLQLIQLNPGDS